MTAESESLAAWRWWEGRRLAFNTGLFCVGWLGFGLQAAVVIVKGVEKDLLGLMLAQGLVYVVYMVIANIAYLCGVIVEAVIKPMPPESYRVRAWALGFGAATGLPLIAACVLAFARLMFS